MSKMVVIPALRALALVSTSGMASAAPSIPGDATFIDSRPGNGVHLKGTTTPVFSISEMPTGKNLLIQGQLSKSSNPTSGANYELRDNSGNIAVSIPAHVIGNNEVNQRIVRIRGDVSVAGAGVRQLSAIQVEILN